MPARIDGSGHAMINGGYPVTAPVIPQQQIVSSPPD
jgi:hypothetical protein